MDKCQYYYILMMIDIDGNISYISDTDPLAFNDNLYSSKLYINNASALTDVKDNLEYFKNIIAHTNIVELDLGFIIKFCNNMKVLRRDQIL